MNALHVSLYISLYNHLFQCSVYQYINLILDEYNIMYDKLYVHFICS